MPNNWHFIREAILSKRKFTFGHCPNLLLGGPEWVGESDYKILRCENPICKFSSTQLGRISSTPQQQVNLSGLYFCIARYQEAKLVELNIEHRTPRGYSTHCWLCLGFAILCAGENTFHFLKIVQGGGYSPIHV